MKNIYVLPTDKPSKLWLTKLGNLTRCHDIKPIKEALGNNVNIYITSDSDLDINDWVTDGKDIWQVSYILADNIQQAKKIILTTDQDLIKDGVQEIDDEFLEWFVKNPSCDEVEVVKEDWKDKTYSYETIIPKEETQGYICQQTKVQCNDEFCVSTEKCNLLPSTDVFSEPKQETLEEAIERTKEEYPVWFDEEAFKLGAKWQQEQILDFLYSEITERRDYSASKMCEKVIEFIEQFKKE